MPYEKEWQARKKFEQHVWGGAQTVRGFRGMLASLRCMQRNVFQFTSCEDVD
jgi:hypothetical protein